MMLNDDDHPQYLLSTPRGALVLRDLERFIKAVEARAMAPHYRIMHSVWWLLCIFYAWMCLWAGFFTLTPMGNGDAQALAFSAVAIWIGACVVIQMRANRESQERTVNVDPAYGPDKTALPVRTPPRENGDG